MSKRSAHVNNKMDVVVQIDGVQVEHITVHPNMFVVPRVGDVYSLVCATRSMDVVSETATDVREGFEQQHERHDGTVIEVHFGHGVIRTRKEGKYSTELMQQVTIILESVAAAVDKVVSPT